MPKVPGRLHSSRILSCSWLAKSALGLVLFAGPACLGQQSQPADNFLAEVTQALRNRQFDSALELSASGLKRSPADPRLWTLQALAYAGLKKSAEALESYHRALRIAPEYLPALQGAAELEYALHKPDAEDLLNRIVAIKASDQTAHAMLGEIFYRKHDCGGSAANFAAASQMIAGHPEVLMHYSACLVQLNRYEQVVPVFQQLLTLDPQSAVARYNLALAQWNLGRFAEAQSALEPALDVERPSEDELTLAAEIYESQGNTQKALELLRKAILLEPRNKNAYLDFVNLSFQHASIQVGLDIVNLGLQQLPDDAELHFARGVLLCQFGKVDDAFADFDTANRLDPRLSFVGVAQGIAQSQSHHSAAALARFREQVKQHPGDALACYLLAEALSQEGKSEGTPEFLEAVQAARRAIRLDPKRVEAYDLLASMYLEADKPQQAISASRDALAINPKDPQALYHLVMALRKTDQKEQLPALLKRLMEARNEAQMQAEKNAPHRLVEVPPPGTPASN